MNRKIKSPIDMYIMERYSPLAQTSVGEMKCEWKPVKLYSKAMENFNTKRFQLLVTISLERTNDDAEKVLARMEQQLNEYKTAALKTEGMIPMTLLVKSMTYYTIDLFVMFPLPEYQTVKEWYANTTIHLKEFQFHMCQAYDIRQIMKSTGNNAQLCGNDYSIGVFFDGVCPFPMIQLTPLWIINQYLPCERIEGCGYCTEIMETKESNQQNQVNECHIKQSVQHHDELKGTKNSFSFLSEEIPVENTSSNVDMTDNNDHENNQSKILLQRLIDIIERETITDKMVETIGKIRTMCETYYIKEISTYYTAGTIGQGAYGQVQRIISGKKNIYVLKSSRGEAFNNLKKEAMILSLCDHPNIVKFIGFKQLVTSRLSSGQLYLELCDCDLQFYADKRRKEGKPLTESEIRSIFHQMVSASEYLYKEFGIIHRDIKLENYLVKEENGQIIVKLCDFGFARKCSGKMIEYVGSPTFCAPEILNNVPYTYKAELFSLGICLFYLLNGRFPFVVTNQKQLIDAYNHRLSMVFNGEIEQELKTMCLNCLSYDVEERMTIQQLKEQSELLLTCG